MTEQEDEETPTTKGRPNKWWSEHRDEYVPDNFGGAYRGVPGTPHGGQARVKAEDTLGAEDCWCGLPADHDWPGKANKAPHPKRGTIMSEQITKKELAGFDSLHQTFILNAVNEVGLRFQQNRQCVTLYPPDGSMPKKVYKRADNQSVKALETWWRGHVSSVIDTEVKVVSEGKKVLPIEAPEDVVKAAVKLAATIGGLEHEPPKPARPEVAAESVQIAPEPEPPEITSRNPEWTPVLMSGSNEDSGFDTDGERIRCRQCFQEGKEIFVKPGGKGGHKRTYHRDTDTLWGPDVIERRTDTLKVNNLRRKIEGIVTSLADAIDMEITGDSKEVAKITALYEKEKERADKAEAARDDALARLALMREALNV